MLDYGLRAMGVRMREAIVGARFAAVLCGLAAMASGCKPAAPGPEQAAAQKTAMLLPVSPAPVLPVEPPQPSPQTGLPKAECRIRFQEVSGDCGITFEHRDGSSGRHFTPETMSAGVATLDYDGDGLIDIYFPNGASLPGVKYDPPPRHALYRNLGAWRFRDVSREAGTDTTAFGLGIAVADYDNDGRPDIYLDNFGPNLLFHNNGDGTYTEVTARAGVPGAAPGGRLAKKVGAGACFLDADGDGLVDLYAGTYIEIDLDTYVTPMKGKYGFYPSPMVYTPVASAFYRNRGDGTFRDESGPSGVGAFHGRCMGTTAADYDNDGDTDVFVCNDVFENFLLRSDGRGKFEQAGFLAGIAVSSNGDMLANMAVDSGDFNHDGWLDFFTTNYDKQYPMLLKNLGDGLFADVTREAGTGESCYASVNWGCAMVDLDNDGYKDIFINMGHTDDNVEFVDSTTAYRLHNVLFRNLGNGRFVDVSKECGLHAVPVHAARGVAFDDLDNDGDLDAAVLNLRERPSVLRNMLQESGTKNHWLQVRLQGVKTNRDGVGARVRVVAGELSQIDEVHSGRGYQSHWGTRLHFGLGSRPRVDRIEVRWIGGGVDVWENIPADHEVVLTEGEGRGPAI